MKERRCFESLIRVSLDVFDVERVIRAEELVLITAAALQLIDAFLVNWLPCDCLELFEDVLEGLGLRLLKDVRQVVETLVEVCVADVLPGLNLVFFLLFLLIHEHTESLDDVLNEVNGFRCYEELDFDYRDWNGWLSHLIPSRYEGEILLLQDHARVWTCLALSFPELCILQLSFKLGDDVFQLKNLVVSLVHLVLVLEETLFVLVFGLESEVVLASGHADVPVVESLLANL